MKKVRKLLFYLALAVCIISVPNTALETHAASKVKLNKKSVTLTKGTYVNLKVSGTKKAVKWSSKNKKIATVNKNGKVSAKKAGQTKIIAKVGSKKLTCTVKVVKQNVDLADTDTNTEIESEICEHGYKSSSIKVQDATCETAGSVLLYCKICNKTLLEIPIEPKGHRISIRGQEEATDDWEGYTGDKYCEVCGKVIEKGTIIPKKGEQGSNPEPTEYVTVKLTPENFNQYFEETTVFGKEIDAFGDTIIRYWQCYILKPEWRNKIISERCKGSIIFTAKWCYADFKVNPETLTGTVTPRYDGVTLNPSGTEFTTAMDLSVVYADNGNCYFAQSFSDEKRIPSFRLDFNTYAPPIDGEPSGVVTFSSSSFCFDISVKKVSEDCVLCFSK